MNRRLFLSTLFPKRKRLDKMRYKRTKLTKKDIKYTSGGIVKLIKEDPGAPISISVIESRGATSYPPVNDCKSLLKEEVAKDIADQFDRVFMIIDDGENNPITEDDMKEVENKLKGMKRMKVDSPVWVERDGTVRRSK